MHTHTHTHTHTHVHIQDYPHGSLHPAYHPTESFEDEKYPLQDALETEESDLASVPSGGDFQMGPFLNAIMDKWNESEKTLAKDRKKPSKHRRQ